MNFLEDTGIALIGESFRYVDNEQKAWTNLSKREARKLGHKIDRNTLYRPSRWSDEIKRPRGPSRNVTRWQSNRDIHWERRPYRGTYTHGKGYERPNIARPHPYKTQQVRTRMRRTGMVLMGTSKALPIIGYASLGYGIHRSMEDPESLLGYGITFLPGYSTIPRAQQEVVQTQARRANAWYLDKWFRGSKPE